MEMKTKLVCSTVLLTAALVMTVKAQAPDAPAFTPTYTILHGFTGEVTSSTGLTVAPAIDALGTIKG
jgi:hypothetical protein